MRRGLLIAAAIVHFLFAVCCGCRDLLDALAKGGAVFTENSARSFARWKSLPEIVLGEQSDGKRNVWGQGVDLYLTISGIESTYGFFAPQVPAADRLTFELHYLDGRKEEEMLHLDAIGSEFRVASFMDFLDRVPDSALRSDLIRLVSSDVWAFHHGLSSMRVRYESIGLPSAAEYERGLRPVVLTTQVFEGKAKPDSSKQAEP